MRTLLIVLAFISVTSCAPKMPIDSQKLFEREAQRAFRREEFTRSVGTMTVVIFGAYCILAWRYDIE